MRENPDPIKFPAKTGQFADVKMVTNTEDLITSNERSVWSEDDDCYNLKTTKYYIEIKCESPHTKDFAGEDLKTEWAADRKKLRAAAKWEADQNPTKTGLRRRYWMIMIGMSDDTVKTMQSLEWNFENPVPGDPNIFIGLDEIIN